MIKLIVLDVDGVIVGHQPGINFPYPKQEIIDALKKVRQKGIAVVLCSGKFYPAVEEIVHRAHLDNPHITDSGSLIIDPIAKKTIGSYYMDKDLVTKILTTCLENNIHIEAFSDTDYFMQQGVSDLVKYKRSQIFQTSPVIVKSIVDEAKEHHIIRFTAIAFNEKDKEKIERILQPFDGLVKTVWTSNPSTHPWKYFLMTALNASKAAALTKVAKSLNIPLENTLGVGDTLGDWEFMKLCGYAATMADAEEELKQEVRTKGEGKYLIGPSVDEDGILKIFDYFLK